MEQSALAEEFAMKYRVKFTKEEEMKYIGHLDIMRLFQRAIRRAQLPVAYSKGFNPHQLLAFANPLSLGMTSGGEYGDFTFTKAVDTKELVDRLNAVLPEGIRVLSAVLLKEGVKNAMACVEAARYEVRLDRALEENELEKSVSSFLEQPEIIVMKKTKHHMKETDIKPDIYAMQARKDETGQKLELLLAAGSNRSLKAELVIQEYYRFMGFSFFPYRIAYRRLDLLRKEGDDFCSLNEGSVCDSF